MYGGSVTRTVEVWGTKYEVDVHQKSKTVWVAVAEFMGEYLQVQGRTQTQAVSSWREAARYKGN
jgi:hypothetical protein